MSLTISMRPNARFLDLPAANVSRYIWASKHLKSRRVLDYGCGHGYGTFFLSDGIADHVVGVDSDSRAINFAVERYKRDNLEFLCVNDFNTRMPSSSFDAVVSFEVIEHLANPRMYLREIRRLLRTDGWLLLSTPNKHWTERFHKSGKPLNPFHVQEYYPTVLREILGDYFETVGCFARFTVGDHDERTAKWGMYMSTCPIPIDMQRNSPTIVKNGIRMLYRYYLQLLGSPPPSELRGGYLLSRIEPIKRAEDILSRFPEQLWWLRKG